MLARYYIAGLVSVSVTSLCSIETAERIELTFAQVLPPTYPTMCCKQIRVSLK